MFYNVIRYIFSNFIMFLIIFFLSCSHQKIQIENKTRHKESPILADLVKSGKLPPVDQRLPENPFVQEVYDEIGKYGGTIRMAWIDRDDKWGPGKCSEEYLIMYNEDGTKIIPNLASWNISNNNKDFTFNLLKGVKWSDGDNFDADDIEFFWKYILTDETIYGKAFPVWLKSPKSETPATYQKIDPYTFKISFTESYPHFMTMFCTEAKDFFVPAHFFKTVLPALIGKEKSDALIKAAGYKNITDYMKWKRYYWWINKEIPSLRAWVAATDYDAVHFIMKRNPYYWKVDKEGNQLPYVDELDFELINDISVINMKATAGELDFQTRHIDVDNYELFRQNAEKGNYRILHYTEDGLRVTILPNQTCKNLGLRKLFQDIRFRIALSLALNRDEINKIIYKGQGKPYQASFVKNTPFYSEKWAGEYIEFNPQLSNQYLDQIGLKWDQTKRCRIMENGKPVDIKLDFSLNNQQIALMIRKYWESIGINVMIREHKREDYEKLKDNNDLEISLWNFNPFNFVINPAQIIPLFNYEWYGTFSQYFQTNGQKGEKPSEDIIKIISLWNNILKATTDKEINSYAQQIVSLHEKNIWMIGTVAELPTLAIVNNRLRNVPSHLFNTDVLRFPGNARLYQFFYQN